MPPSLEILNLGDDSFNHTNKFTGGIPAEWGSLTSLKELKMVACGLHGALCRTSSTQKDAKFVELSFCLGIVPEGERACIRLTGLQFQKRLHTRLTIPIEGLHLCPEERCSQTINLHL